MMVMRLRRKIEPNAARPSLIVTVPGSGYRFSVPVRQTAGVADGPEVIPAAARLPAAPRPSPRRYALGWQLPVVAGTVTLVFACVGWVWWQRPSIVPMDTVPVVAVLPLANLGGDPSQDYFSRGVTSTLTAVLASFATLKVVSLGLPQAPYEAGPLAIGRQSGADYLLSGGVLKGADRVRITAQLTNVHTGQDVWGTRYDAQGSDVFTLQADIADRIDTALAGLTGVVHQEETASAWRKSPTSLSEYDYYLRGLDLFFVSIRSKCCARGRFGPRACSETPGRHCCGPSSGSPTGG